MKKNKAEKKPVNGTPFYKKASFKYGSLSTALIAIFIVLVIGVNLLSTFISERFSVDIDLTSSGDYSVSDENKKVIESISKPVSIIFTTTEEYYSGGSYYQTLNYSGYTDSTGGKYMKQTVELLKNYKKLNPNITVEFIDAQTPAFDTYREQFSDYMSTVNYGDLIVYCKDTNKHKFLGASDLYSIESSQSSSYYSQSSVITGSNVEAAVTSALDYVAADSEDVVTMITGYNSSDTSDLKTLFEKNNYTVKTISDLLTSDIPEETDVLVLASPTVDLTNDEIKKIDTFLENGGKHGKNMLYFASSSQLSTPNLDALLLDWGIKFEYGTVTETDSDYALSSENGKAATAMMLKLADNDTVSKVAGEYSESQFVGSSQRPMYTSFDENGKYHTAEIIKTSDGTTVMPNGAADDWQPASDSVKRSYSSMILSTYATGDKDNNGEEIRSNVCAVSGIDCVSFSSYYSFVKTNNVLVNVTNSMVNKGDNSYVFDNKEISTNSLTVTEAQTNIVKTVFWAVPALIIAVGIVVYVRRKHR